MLRDEGTEGSENEVNKQKGSELWVSCGVLVDKKKTRRTKSQLSFSRQGKRKRAHPCHSFIHSFIRISFSSIHPFIPPLSLLSFSLLLLSPPPARPLSAHHPHTKGDFPSFTPPSRHPLLPSPGYPFSELEPPLPLLAPLFPPFVPSLPFHSIYTSSPVHTPRSIPLIFSTFCRYLSSLWIASFLITAL